MCQDIPQAPHVALVAFSLRLSPVASVDQPRVTTAAVAFPPEIPFLFFTRLVVTCPWVPQWGHTSAVDVGPGGTLTAVA